MGWLGASVVVRASGLHPEQCRPEARTTIMPFRFPLSASGRGLGGGVARGLFHSQRLSLGPRSTPRRPRSKSMISTLLLGSITIASRLPRRNASRKFGIALEQLEIRLALGLDR